MANPNELRRARARLGAAVTELACLEALPRRVGGFVIWSNGVHWVRLGDDRWQPGHTVDADGDPWVYSSAHVASGTVIAQGEVDHNER